MKSTGIERLTSWGLVVIIALVPILITGVAGLAQEKLPLYFGKMILQPMLLVYLRL